MLHRCFLILASLVLAASLTSSAHPAIAQDGDTACPAIVQAALEAAGQVCAGLNRDEACYGNDRVDAVFWEARDDLIFSAPSDRVPLLDLQSLATAPLDLDNALWGVAVLNVRANLPETMPGQAVTFLLMGDAVLENAVSPEEAAPPVTPIAAVAAVPANLRSRPSTRANVIGSVPAGTELQLVGVNEAGDWYEVLADDGGRAWVSALLLESNDSLADLPITYGPNTPPRYGPMQAFYFTTGMGAPACHEAPNALVVQSPNGVPVALNVNGLDIQFGSTIILTTAQGSIAADIADSQDAVLIVSLIEGRLYASLPDGPSIWLELEGQSLATTLNADGLIDTSSTVIPLADTEAIAGIIAQAYQNAIDGGLIADPGVPVEDLDVTFYEPPETLPLPSDAGEPGLETCGDTFCDLALGENAVTCPADCPELACGNDICEAGEDVAACPADCPELTCGNGICEAGEDLAACPADCTIPTCGDTFCDLALGENTVTCPADCLLPEPFCGNALCEDGEDAVNCAGDCGSPPASVCGNEIVEPGELCDDGNLIDNDGCSALCMPEW